MTKIVKTIDKVTNHENMRRYLHKKASKGGGTITSDSITLELLEDTDVLNKIRNWGLSNEEALQLPRISMVIDNSGTVDEDILYEVSTTNNSISYLEFNGKTYQDSQSIEGYFIDDFINLNPQPEYINYSVYDGMIGTVLKKSSRDSDNVYYISATSEIEIRICLNERYVRLSLGADTY
jgi:hypothetical protein